MFENFLGKQKAKSRYGITLARLDFLIRDLKEERALKVDRKYWEEELKNLEEYSKYLPYIKEDIAMYEALYADYLQKYHSN